MQNAKPITIEEIKAWAQEEDPMQAYFQNCLRILEEIEAAQKDAE